MNTDKIYAEQLANEYALKDTSKVNALRKLDAKAKLPATVFTYTFGIITALVAGVGMCLSMKVIGSGSTTIFVLGVIVGIIGLLGMGVNYPIYKKLLAQGKQKYAFEIMELAKEIKAGKTTAVEAMKAVLEQIEKTEETYHCYITIDKEKAMQAAKEAQEKIEAGILLSLIHI